MLFIFFLCFFDLLQNFRAALYRALGHIFSNTPLAVLVAEAKKVCFENLILEVKFLWISFICILNQLCSFFSKIFVCNLR